MFYFLHEIFLRASSLTKVPVDQVSVTQSREAIVESSIQTTALLLNSLLKPNMIVVFGSILTVSIFVVFAKPIMYCRSMGK